MNYLKREKKNTVCGYFLNTFYFWFNSVLFLVPNGTSIVSLQALLSNGNQDICHCRKHWHFMTKKNNWLIKRKGCRCLLSWGRGGARLGSIYFASKLSNNWLHCCKTNHIKNKRHKITSSLWHGYTKMNLHA